MYRCGETNAAFSVSFDMLAMMKDQKTCCSEEPCSCIQKVKISSNV